MHPSLILTLLILAAALAAASLLESSDASISAQKSNPVQVSASSLTLNSTAGQILSASGMRPGLSRTGTVNLTGSGSASSLRVRVQDLTDTPASPSLSAVLQLKIEDISGTPLTLYDSSLSGLVSSSGVSLGGLSPGVSRQFRLTLSWPSASSSPVLQGASSTFTFRFQGET